MIESRHGFPAGDRVRRGGAATIGIVDAGVNGYTAIIEVISTLELCLAEWAEGPQLIRAPASIRGR